MTICIEKKTNVDTLDMITLRKLCPPITGHQQYYEITAGDYSEREQLSFRLSRSELMSLYKQIQ